MCCRYAIRAHAPPGRLSTGSRGRLPDKSAHAFASPLGPQVRYRLITRLSAARLWLPSDLRPERSRHVALAALRQLMAAPARLGSSTRAELACLQPGAHLGATEERCVELVAQAEQVRQSSRLFAHRVGRYGY